MRKHLSAILLIVAATSQASAVGIDQTVDSWPDSARFGFVDIPRVFKESAQGKAAAARLKAFNDKKEVENSAKQAALRDSQQRRQNSPTESEFRAQLDKDIERQQIELQRWRQDTQTELAELQAGLQREFSANLNSVLGEIGVEKNLDLIFNNVDPSIGWHDANLDLSLEVIRRLDVKNTAGK
jgi:Skp family chaperone for outer membrane proteins